MNRYKAIREVIANYNIKINDIVIVDHIPSTCERIGWTINWCNDMDSLIGQEGIVFEIGRDNGISVSFPNGNNYSFPVFCLKVIEDTGNKINEAYKTLQLDSCLEVSDIVQVIRSNKASELGCACFSSDSTEIKNEVVESKAIGKIIAINPRSIRVQFGKCDWAFPYFSLKKVEPKLEDIKTRYFSDGKEITHEINQNGIKEINKKIKTRKDNKTEYKKNLVDIKLPAATLEELSTSPRTANRSIMEAFGEATRREIITDH